MKHSIIKLPNNLNARGNISFVEDDIHLQFKIQRIYWIYDVTGGKIRGGHAFKETQALIIALSGSIDVILNDGEQEYKYSLNRSYNGVLVPRMMWRTLQNFSTNSLAVIISSTDYDAN